MVDLNHKLSTEQKFYRNIIRIVGFDKKRRDVVHVIIPGWRPNVSVPLPLSTVREWLDDFHPQIGTRLIAKVNICATKPEDLNFTEFEAVFEPNAIKDLKK